MTIPQSAPVQNCSRRKGYARIGVRALFGILLASTIGYGSDGKLELRGEIQPAIESAVVGIYGVEQSFVARTESNAAGRFHFSNITPGIYMVQVQVPNANTVTRTVDITPSFADDRRTVHFTMSVRPSEVKGAHFASASYFVSVQQLQKPGKAAKEYDKALASLKHGDVETARKHLERAVDISPDYAIAWNHLGAMETQAGHFDKAERYFREAFRHDSKSIEPLTNLGGTLLKLGKCQDALQYNLEAEHRRPEEALVNSRLGKNYLCLGDNQRAIRYLVKAQTIDPSLAEFPQLYLAKIYLSQSDSPAALSELNNFVERHPDLRETLKVRHWIEVIENASRRDSGPDNMAER